ncbi:hypothetical protein [Rhodococcus sp. (in: high G+C Gram-positive bacteria)]|uniref:hypothetical protein n=1 Tax=Rhodococcus sp. TaxID=1831 RepID=UPI003B8A5ECE
MGRVYPEGLQQFTFDHSTYGTVLATGQDGASWRIEVRNNNVTVVETSGPAPTEYVLFLLPRARLFDLEREFDAAFDLAQFEGRIRLVRGDPRAGGGVCARTVPGGGAR